MLSLVLTLTLLAQTPESVGGPASTLTIELAEAVGSRIKRLAVPLVDASTSEEHTRLVAAIERTGLFTVVVDQSQEATLELRRVSPTEVLVAVTGREGERLWVKGFAWLAGETGAPTRTDDERYDLVKQYERRALAVRPIQRLVGASGFAFAWGAPAPFGDPAWGYSTGMGAAVPVQPGQLVADWAVVRGKVEQLDELDFARLLADETLVRRVEEGRFWPRLYWALGFGAGAVAGVGGGLVLRTNDDRDVRTIGYSVLTLGIASAILTVFAPAVGPEHVLPASEVEPLVDRFNAELRRELGLRPTDLAH